MLLLEANRRYTEFSEPSLLVHVLFNNPIEVIQNDWPMFQLQTFNTIGGEALELMVDKAKDQIDVFLPLLLERFDHFEGRATDKNRLFYPALSLLFRYTGSEEIQRRLRLLNSSTASFAELRSPEWVDNYTFEELEFEFLSDVGKGVTGDISIDFDSDFDFEDEDLGLAGDGLHTEVVPVHMEMQKDLMLSFDQISKIKKMVNENSEKLYEKFDFRTVKRLVEDLETSEERLVAYILFQDRFCYRLNTLSDMKKIKANHISLYEFSVMFGEEILSGANLDKDRFGSMLNSSPAWKEMTDQELEEFHLDTIKKLANVDRKYSREKALRYWKEFKEIAYTLLDLYKDELSKEQEPISYWQVFNNPLAFVGAQFAIKDMEGDQSIPMSEPYLIGFYRSIINGGSYEDAKGAGWLNYRMSVSPDGQAAFTQALKEGKTYKEAMRAFWTLANNSIVSVNSSNLKLRSGAIDWRRAYYKAKANEFPASQMPKLFQAAKSLFSKNPSNYWLKMVAELS